MAKEFDIYLRGRQFNCDLIVLSLPFRDGIAAASGILVSSDVKGLALLGTIGGSSVYNIKADINEFLVRCFEEMNSQMMPSVNVGFQVRFPLDPEQNEFVISADNISALINFLNKGENQLSLHIPPINAMIGKSIGAGKSEMKLDVDASHVSKNSLLNCDNRIAWSADIDHINEQSFLRADTSTYVTPDIKNLLYRITSRIDGGMEISALVLGTEIHFSFGRAYCNMAFGCKVSNERMAKFEIARSALATSSTVFDSATKYIDTDDSTMHILFETQCILKRCRLLNELEAETLETISEMTLEELSYIII